MKFLNHFSRNTILLILNYVCHHWYQQTWWGRKFLEFEQVSFENPGTIINIHYFQEPQKLLDVPLMCRSIERPPMLDISFNRCILDIQWKFFLQHFVSLWESKNKNLKICHLGILILTFFFLVFYIRLLKVINWLFSSSTVIE